MPRERIVAVGLLTEDDLSRLDGVFKLWPVEDVPCFNELLQAIDEADAELDLVERGRGGRRGSD